MTPYRLLVLFLVSLATGACGSRTPIAPGPIAAPPSTGDAPPAIRPSFHVAGFVLDGNDAPIAGATLIFWSSPQVVAESGVDGRYDVTVTNNWVTVSKNGYESSELGVKTDAAATTSQNLRLHQIRSIAAGESVRLSVKPDDPACGYHYGFVCRRVRVTSGEAGKLTLDVRSDGAAAFGLFIELPGWPSPLGPSMSVAVAPGSVISFDLGTPSPLVETQQVTLTTTFVSAQ